MNSEKSDVRLDIIYKVDDNDLLSYMALNDSDRELAENEIVPKERNQTKQRDSIRIGSKCKAIVEKDTAAIAAIFNSFLFISSPLVELLVC